MFSQYKLYIYAATLIALIGGSFWFGYSYAKNKVENENKTDDIVEYQNIVNNLVTDIKEYNKQSEIDFNNALLKSEERQAAQITKNLRREKIFELTKDGQYVSTDCEISDELLKELNNSIRNDSNSNGGRR